MLFFNDILFCYRYSYRRICTFRKAFRPMAPIRIDNESMRFDSVTPDKCLVRPAVVHVGHACNTSRSRRVIFLGHRSGAGKSKLKRRANGCNPFRKSVGQTATKTRGRRIDRGKRTSCRVRRRFGETAGCPTSVGFDVTIENAIGNI